MRMTIFKRSFLSTGIARSTTRRLALLPLFFLLLASGERPANPADELQERQGDTSRKNEEQTSGVPPKAVTVYEHVLETGRPLQGYVGGRVWQNRERRLPEGGNYREFDVNPKVRGQNRGAERIIVDLDTGEGWYTGDHYRTFTPIKRKNRDK